MELLAGAEAVSNGMRTASYLLGVGGKALDVVKELVDIPIATYKFLKTPFVGSDSAKETLMTPIKTRRMKRPRFGDGGSAFSIAASDETQQDLLRRGKMARQGIYDGKIYPLAAGDIHRFIGESAKRFIDNPVHGGALRLWDVGGYKRNPFNKGNEHLLPMTADGLRNIVSFDGDESPSLGVQYNRPVARVLSS